MSTIVEGKDTVRFVDEEEINKAPVTEDKEETAKEETAKEEEAASAYNPETGEINWDCPCLGGMASGPCGDQFKAAFSCFVYSEAEPKGLDCVEKFKDMQDCFRRHPDVYGDEIDDDDDEEEVEKTVEEAKAVVEEAEEKKEEEETVTPASAYEEESSVSAWISSWF